MTPSNNKSITSSRDVEDLKSADHRGPSNPTYDTVSMSTEVENLVSAKYRVPSSPEYSVTSTSDEVDDIAPAGDRIPSDHSYNIISPSASTHRSISKPIASRKVVSTQQPDSLCPLTIKPLTGFVASLARQRVNIIKREEFAFHNKSVESGATMSVRQASWKTASGAVHVVAVKTLIVDSQRDTSALLQDMLFEIQVMCHKPLCHHRNIMTLLGVAFSDLESQDTCAVSFQPMLVVPWADSGTVADLCRGQSVPYSAAASITADVADGLQALHLYGIVHADIKPNNVLLFSDASAEGGLISKLSDFGFCTSEQDQIEILRGRTLQWAAPETYDGPKPRISPMADVFSFGQLAMFLALEGIWDPWRHNEETIDQLRLRTCQCLRDYESASVSHIERWLFVLRNTVVQDPAARLPSHKLGDIRSRLLEKDSFWAENEKHFRNVIPYRGTKGWLNSQDRVTVAVSSPPLPWMGNFIRALPEDIKVVLRQDWDQINFKNLVDRGLHPTSAISRHDLSQLAVFGPALDQVENREGAVWRFALAGSRGLLASILFNNNEAKIQVGQIYFKTIISLIFASLLSQMEMGWFEQPAGLKRMSKRDVTFDWENMPDFWRAATKGDLNLVSRIVENDQQVLRTVYHGGTLVHAAASYNDKDLMTVLLNLNESAVNWYDSTGQTPLHIAAAFGYLEMVKLLLESSYTDPAATSENLGTPMRFALIQYSQLSLLPGTAEEIIRLREIIRLLQNKTPVVKSTQRWPIEGWPIVSKILLDLITNLFTMCTSLAFSAAGGFGLLIAMISSIMRTASWFNGLEMIPNLLKFCMIPLGMMLATKLPSNDTHTGACYLIGFIAIDILQRSWNLKIIHDLVILLLLRRVSDVLCIRDRNARRYRQQDLSRQWQALEMPGEIDVDVNRPEKKLWEFYHKILVLSYQRLRQLTVMEKEKQS